MNFLKTLLWAAKKFSLHVLTNQDGNLGKMFTPPKSKSPWEAMTAGSTGGWAAPAGPSTPTNPNDPAGWGWVGPALTTAAGAIPGIGPALSAGMGAIGAAGQGSGFQGTDYGWNNLGSTALGAFKGYGLGGLGAGTAGAIGNAWGNQSGSLLSNLTSGFKSGVGDYTKPVTDFLGGMFGGAGGAGTSSVNTSPINGPVWNASTGTFTNPATLGQSGAGGLAPVAGGSGAGAGTTGGQNIWQQIAGMFGGQGKEGALDLSKIMGAGGISSILGLGAQGGAAAGAFGAEDTTQIQTPAERYDDAMKTVVGKYLGESGMALPTRAREEYMNIINTPFGDLYDKWDVSDQRFQELEGTIDRSYDEADNRIAEAFAQAGGGDLSQNTDYQKALQKSTRLRAEEKRLGQNQIRYENFREAVSIKMDALKNAMAQGEWDSKLAMDLAKQAGQEEMLLLAMQRDDYGAFQDAMGKVMQWGEMMKGNTNTVSGPSNLWQLSGSLGI